MMVSDGRCCLVSVGVGLIWLFLVDVGSFLCWIDRYLKMFGWCFVVVCEFLC